MKRLRSMIVLLSLSVSLTAQAAPRELTIFADGTVAELEATARKGVIELTLPGQIREGTLRVKPLDNAVIGQVDLLPARVPEKLQKELDSLTEQKNRLQDRLKALDHREGIFAAAAKSQSSKAPRKTKTNPDPLTSVRQGTDFAIAQLESVYTARRKAEHDLKRIETRLAALSSKGITGPTVRVMVTPAAARIRIAAVLQDGGWSPRYELRLQGNSAAQLVLLATVTQLPDGFVARVTPAKLAGGAAQQSFNLPVGVSSRLAEWQLPVEKEQISNGPLPAFSCILKNSTGSSLPAGQTAVYSKGEYVGMVRFPGLASDASVTLAGPAP